MQNESYRADNGGIRYDEGKPQFHLIPSDGLSELAKVYVFGASKYAPYNWERGMAWSRVFNALLRHLYAFWDGERHDKETGLHHMAHVAWNALALLVYSLRGIGEDDRKASFLSAQQNREASKLSVEDLGQRELPPVVKKKRIDGVDPIKDFVERKTSQTLHCVHCPDRFALTGRDICSRCYVEGKMNG